jgi:LysM repeat protein
LEKGSALEAVWGNPTLYAKTECEPSGTTPGPVAPPKPTEPVVTPTHPTPPKPTKPTVAPTPPTPPKPTPTAGTRTYRIQKGDTAWGIARRHHLTIADLERLNPGLDPDYIRIGDTIVIAAGKPAPTPPAPTKPVPVVTPTAPTAPVPPPSPKMTIEVNGKPTSMDVEIIDGRAYVPIRALGGALGASVRYDASSRIVRVGTGEATASAEKSR